MSEAERFYDLVDRLAAGLGGARRLGECSGISGWPQRGVYFFFEPDERHGFGDGGVRVVRVGTHAVSNASKTTLWKRLSNHRGVLAGGGNHRGSIFRHHVGAALMRREPERFPVASWQEKVRPTGAVLAAELDLEQAVSAQIGAMTVLWVAVDDEASRHSQRAYVERNAIALLAGAGRQDPGSTWLGRYSDRVDIRESGLWNLNHLNHALDAGFLDCFAALVDATVAGAATSWKPGAGR